MRPAPPALAALLCALALAGCAAPGPALGPEAARQADLAQQLASPGDLGDGWTLAEVDSLGPLRALGYRLDGNPDFLDPSLAPGPAKQLLAIAYAPSEPGRGAFLVLSLAASYDGANAARLAAAHRCLGQTVLAGGTVSSLAAVPLDDSLATETAVDALQAAAGRLAARTGGEVDGCPVLWAEPAASDAPTPGPHAPVDNRTAADVPPPEGWPMLFLPTEEDHGGGFQLAPGDGWGDNPGPDPEWARTDIWERNGVMPVAGHHAAYDVEGDSSDGVRSDALRFADEALAQAWLEAELSGGDDRCSYYPLTLVAVGPVVTVLSGHYEPHDGHDGTAAMAQGFEAAGRALSERLGVEAITCPWTPQEERLLTPSPTHSDSSSSSASPG
jgi:hypothetical protein